MKRKPDRWTLARLGGRWRHHPRYQGCVGHWLFNEGVGTTVRDMSSRRRHASFVNTPTWTTGALGGSALSLEGTSASLLIGDFPEYTFTLQGFSVGGWVRRDTATRYEAIFGKYQKAGGQPREWTFGFAADDLLYAFIYDNTNAAFIGRTAPDVSASTWHHIMLVYDGGITSASVKIYVNGFRTDTANTEAGTFVSSVDTTQTFTIGAYDEGLGGPFDGTIDDSRIVRRAYTEGEVQSLVQDPFEEFRWALEQPKIIYSIPASPGGGVASSYYYRMAG